MTSFTLLPAIDIVGGKAVRLDKGEAGTETDYGDPVAAARRWREAGARWLHVVDLDAAFGRGHNHEAISAICAEGGISIELTGGIRDDDAVERALATGASRISVGTAALELPEWIAGVIDRYPEQVAVDLAVRAADSGWRVSGRGWVSDGGDLWEALERLDAAGCRRFVVTDVSRDGTLQGPNVDLLRDVSAATDASVTASGGIGTLKDLEEVARYVDEGIDAAILGRALYEGTIDLAEALAAVDW